MLFEHAMETDFQIELLFGQAAMADSEFLMDEFDGEDGFGRRQWGCFLDAEEVISSFAVVKNGEHNQPCVCALAFGFGDNSKGQLSGQWGELRVSDHDGWRLGQLSSEIEHI